MRKGWSTPDTTDEYTKGPDYPEGRVVTKDEAQAVTWFCKAAEQGHEKTKKNIANLSKVLGNKSVKNYPAEPPAILKGSGLFCINILT